MRQLWILPLMLAACACSSEDHAANEAEDARVVQAVRKANAAPPGIVEVTPEPLLSPDIERWDLYGQSCAYAPGTSLGARVIAREGDAFMKIDGDLVRFASDSGSREMPMRTRSVYNGREFSLRLEIVDHDKEASLKSGPGTYEGTIWLRDQWDRVVYQGSGTVSCAA